MKRIDDPSLELGESGKKAYSLKELSQSGFSVPPGFVVSHAERLVEKALEQAIAAIGGFPVAIRSSVEDLEGASFAGQYQSYLNVSSLAEVKEKIAACRASGKGAQVRAYLASRGLAEVEPAVHVLVQKMVDSRWAGVAFTLHPVSGKEEHALVEYCEGLGERLASDHLTPAQLTLELRTGQAVAAEDGDVSEPLPAAAVSELARLALEIQARFHAPQDIEWAIGSDGAIQILQSRPMAQVQARKDLEGFTNAEFNDGGVSARVCTPLMYSLYRQVIQTSMPEYFRKIRLLGVHAPRESWITMFYGRPYWNSSAVRRVKGSVRGWTVALAFEAEFRRCLRESRNFIEEFDKQEARYHKHARNLASMGDGRFFDDLKRILFEFYLWSERAYFNVVYNNDSAQAELKSLVRRIDEATHGQTQITRLLAGLGDVSQLELQREVLELHRVARECGIESDSFERALHFFLERSYFYSDAELELMTPRWGEDPERVIRMIRSMVDSGASLADPDTTAQKQHKDFEVEARNVRARIGKSPFTRLRFLAAFDWRLERARHYLTLREAMRERSSKAYALVRLYVLEAGRRWASKGLLKDPEQVFMLELSELGSIIQRQSLDGALSSDLEFRRKIYDGYSKFTPPHEIGRASSSSSSARELTGQGCSSGQYVGRARVIHSLEEMSQIRPGEILVTSFTEPGWTPVLSIVRGVITEVGGMLSHAAVIGREFGIPAILNVRNATRLVKTGDLLEVNGSTGWIRVLEGALAEKAPEAQQHDYREERQIEESLSAASIGTDSKRPKKKSAEAPARHRPPS
jgi:phosphohistidine swiveling domain-containing protein